MGVAGQPAPALQPRLGRSRRQPVVGAQAARLVGRGQESGRASTRPTSTRRSRRTTAARRRSRPRGDPRRPPLHHAGRRPRLALRAAGPRRRAAARRTTSRTSRRSQNPLYGQRANPARQQNDLAGTLQPGANEPGAEMYPYVVTTYRLTEHHTAGGMSAHVPYLAELQPELFVEVHPELAARARARARRLGHDRDGALGDRSARHGHRPHAARADRRRRPPPGRASLPLGLRGLTTGGAANDLTHMALDPNVHIQEVKALTCDIRPGRRPRAAAAEFVADRREQTRRAMSVDCRGEAPAGSVAGHVRRRGEASDGVLHRHVGLHRLQGLRGRVQGVEPDPPGRPRLDRAELRQHGAAERELLAPRRVRRAAQPLRSTASGHVDGRCGVGPSRSAG